MDQARGKSLLIVEPDQLFRRELEDRCVALGLEPVAVADWKQAIAVLDRPHRICGMVLELVLAPGGPNGLALTGMARWRTPHLPVVLYASQPELLCEVPIGIAACLARSVGAERIVTAAATLVDADAPIQAAHGLGQRRLPLSLGASHAPFEPARYTVDEKLTFLSANQKALSCWKLEPNQVVGRRFLEAFPQAAASEPFKAHLEVLDSGRCYRGFVMSPILHAPIDLSVRPRRGGLDVAFNLLLAA